MKNFRLKSRNATYTITPDSRLEEQDLSIYFYYWLNRTPPWKVRGEDLRNLTEEDFSYKKIWEQAFSHLFGGWDPNFNRLMEEEILKFNIEQKFIQGWYNDNLQRRNIVIRATKYFISLCPLCKKAINIHLSRPKRLCPNCARIKDARDQKIRRDIKQGCRRCKNCGKPLPKKYPNRVYCPGGACKQKAFREREERKIWTKDIEEFIKNGCMVG